MKYLILSLFLCFSAVLNAQKVDYVYAEATDFTQMGKLMPGKTENPYHRVDTTLYKGFTKRENQLVRMSSGMGCVFKTDSRSISIIFSIRCFCLIKTKFNSLFTIFFHYNIPLAIVTF